MAHRRDQADVRRPFQAGRADRLAVPRRRLCQPLRRGGGRRHRSGRHGQGDLGDVHALRSARGHGDFARLLVVGARSDGLWREGPAQRPRRHRRLQAVRPPRHVPDRGAGEPRRSRHWCAPSSGTSCRSDDAHDRQNRHHAQHQRPRARDPRRAAQDPGRCHPRGLRADRHAYRLRAWRLRRLHGDRRRRGGALLPDVRGAGAGQADPHGGGAGARARRCIRCSAPSCASRAAMRLLHAGLPDAGGQHAGEKSRDRRRGIARRAVLESLPLHRLHEHRQGGEGRARRDEAGAGGAGHRRAANRHCG